MVTILLLLIITGVYGLFFYTAQLCQDIDDLLIQLNDHVKEEDWEAATTKTEKLKEQWDHADFFWSTFVDHKEIDFVDESVARIALLVKIKKRDELLVEIGLARRFIYRIKENETPDLQSVF